LSKNSYNSDKGNSKKVKEAKVAVVIPAKNEEPRIGKTLESFLNQDLKPYRIIVVDDGSSDKTGEISSNYNGVEVVTRPFRKENLVAKKELAETFNAGLQKLSNDECDFILISGADLIIPKNYISTIVTRMIENPKIAVSSGIVKGEYSNVPRGPGRIVRYDLWKKLGLIYPINYGFEAYLLMKLESLGYENTVYNDMIATTQRKTGSEYHPTRYYYYGLGLKALGYTTLYALTKILLFAKKKPKGAYYMLKGYFSDYDNLYEPELRSYVKKTQLHNILHLDVRYLKRIFNR
jgi:glycosyltransferase involved in cell wall biosynthesis